MMIPIFNNRASCFEEPEGEANSDMFSSPLLIRVATCCKCTNSCSQKSIPESCVFVPLTCNITVALPPPAFQTMVANLPAVLFKF
eukprot:1029686-Amphidinium_carterae.2